MSSAGLLAFGKDVFHHACGGELHREESQWADGRVLCCGACKARFSVAEWDEAQMELTALGALLRPLYGLGWRAAAQS